MFLSLKAELGVLPSDYVEPLLPLPVPINVTMPVNITES
jgi:hypothetical protein